MRWTRKTAEQQDFPSHHVFASILADKQILERFAMIRRSHWFIAASASVLAACGGGNGNGSDAAERVPTLRRGISAKVDTLDPHKSSAQWEDFIIGDMFVGLMTDGPDGKPVPGVAERYEVSADALTWTFELRETVWSDGVPLTAEDFVYALRRIQNPETASQYAALLYVVKNAAAVNNGDASPEELGVRAIDDQTLEITLETPAPYLLGLLSHYSSYPVPRHVVEQYGDAWIQPENIVVNGPYKLVYWRTGDQLVTEKNPLWAGADELCFERVVYLELEDLEAAVRRIEAGDMDINNAFDGAKKAELEARLPGWVRTSPALITTYWSFNGTQPPFDNPDVRKALSMALDREFLTGEVLTPGYVPAYSLVPPGIANYEVDRPQVSWKSMNREARLAEARSLLEEAGFGPDNPLEFEFIHRSTDDNNKPPPVAQANWREIADWVRPTIVKQDTKVLYARLRQNDFEVSDAGWVADFDDPFNYLFLLESSTGQQNYGDYANPEYDALLSASSLELDLEKRAEILAQAETIMLEESAIAPMWYQVTKNLVDPKLTGWVDNPQEKNRSRYLCRSE